MRRIRILVLTVLVSVNFAIGQTNVDFFGQKPIGENAVIFAPAILSTIHHEHSRLEFSKDGNEIFWAVIPIDTVKRNKHQNAYLIDQQKIWHIYKTKQGWSEPRVLEFTADSKSGVPTLSVDQQSLFFYQTDPNTPKDVRPKKSNLLSVKRKGENRGKPEIIENMIPKVEGKATMAFTIADNGNVYYDLGGPDEHGNWIWKIYFREFKDGKYQDPIMLKNKIDISMVNWCPFVAPDESYLIFSSHRYGGYGNGDLYICFKGKNNGWTEPINMGQSVNTSSQERFPSVSPDGKYLFFARHQYKTFNDYFWIDASIIEKLKKQIYK